jgi:hypothetical protein
MASVVGIRAKEGAYLLTPHLRHVDAYNGTLSARPCGACIERRPLCEISTFRDGQQPKLREISFQLSVFGFDQIFLSVAAV